MGINFLPGGLKALTQEEQHRIVEIVREGNGVQLSRSHFNDVVLFIFEDIPGLERLTAMQCRFLLSALWRLYCLSRTAAMPSESSHDEAPGPPTLTTMNVPLLSDRTFPQQQRSGPPAPSTAVGRGDFDRYMVPCYAPSNVIPVSGKGARVWDQDGREYIDFGGGIAVTSLGHSHPALVEALTRQAEKLWHVSNVYTNEPALRLARKLADATFADRVFFANSGAEANEAAFKLARRYCKDRFGDQKHEIVAALDSFHGRTLFTVSVAGQSKYSDGFGPAIAGVRHVPFNNIRALEGAVSSRTCAVVIEPVQGESGVVPADHAYLARARELCDRHGALLVFDEVQTGMGRVGTLFAYQHYGVTPDVLTAAKAMGGGFPLAAMLTRADLAAHLGLGSHGSTYGGNPLACAVGEAVLDIVNSPSVLRGVSQRHRKLRAGLTRIGGKTGVFREVRGMGLLLGCVLADAWKERARDLIAACEREGLLILQAGGRVLRLAPSLLIDPGEIDEGLSRLQRAIDSF